MANTWHFVDRLILFERLSLVCYAALSKEGLLRDQTVAATETIILWCYNETVRVLNYITKKPGLNLSFFWEILFINSIESRRWCEEERKTRSVRLCASPIKYAQQEVSADLPQILYYLIAARLRDPEISRFLSFFASLLWKKSYRNSLPRSSFCLSYFSWGGSLSSQDASRSSQKESCVLQVAFPFSQIWCV